MARSGRGFHRRLRGNLETLIPLSLDRLSPGGRLVMTFVTLENLGEASALLKASGTPWEAMQTAFDNSIRGAHISDGQAKSAHDRHTSSYA